MTTPDTPWLTIEQAADRLQVHVRTVERMVASGRLREHRGSERVRRYHVDDVDAVMQPLDPIREATDEALAADQQQFAEQMLQTDPRLTRDPDN